MNALVALTECVEALMSDAGDIDDLYGLHDALSDACAKVDARIDDIENWRDDPGAYRCCVTGQLWRTGA